MLDKLCAALVIFALAFSVYSLVWTLGRLEVRLLNEVLKIIGG